MVSNITDFIIEPSVVDVNKSFRVKIKVKDIYLSKKIFITENEIPIITEDGKLIRTEWGDE